MKKILVAIVLLILSLYGLEAAYGFFIKQNVNIKVSRITKGGMQNDLLFHGPCEPVFTVNPVYIDSALGTRSFNLAVEHTDFADNYLHLYLYFKNNALPKQVYLYVTPESFDVRFNTFHTYFFAPYLEDSVVKSVVSEMDEGFVRTSIFPFARYSYYNSYKTFDFLHGMSYWVRNKSEPFHKKGFVKHPDTEFYKRPNGYIAPEHLLYSANFSISSLNDSSLYYELYEERQSFNWDIRREKYLRKIFELCHANDVELILFESPAYKESLKDQPNRNEFLERTKRIAKSYNSEYLILQDDVICEDKRNFVCPLILSVKGTEPFLKIFSDSIRTRFFE